MRRRRRITARAAMLGAGLGAALALAACGEAGAPSGAASAVTLYGVTLGAPAAAMPLCPRMGRDEPEAADYRAKLQRAVSQVDEAHIRVPCVAANPVREDLARVTRGYAMRFPALDPPAFIAAADVGIVEGRVAEVRIVTTGIAGEREAFERLQQKFGAPASAHTETRQNLFGAKFPVTTARWQLGEVEIVFTGAEDTLERGSIVARTAAGRAADAALARAQAARGPQL